MPSNRPIFLFAFANDEAYRLRLEAEERALREALAEADGRKQIEYKAIGQASLDDIFNAFNRLNNQVCPSIMEAIPTASSSTSVAHAPAPGAWPRSWGSKSISSWYSSMAAPTGRR